MTLRLGVLISGGGTTLLNLHRRIDSGTLDAKIACVVSSSRKARGVERARDRGDVVQVIPRRRFEDDLSYSREITTFLVRHRVDLVVLAGFLKRYCPLDPFQSACINIHPALIPAFCGKGYYGMKVHEAVWRRGCRVSGCTVHFVNNEYDAGPIILQKTVALDHRDTAEDIRAKVFQAECEALPEAIQLFQSRRLRVEEGRVIIA